MVVVFRILHSSDAIDQRLGAVTRCHGEMYPTIGKERLVLHRVRRLDVKQLVEAGYRVHLRILPRVRKLCFSLETKCQVPCV